MQKKIHHTYLTLMLKLGLEQKVFWLVLTLLITVIALACHIAAPLILKNIIDQLSYHSNMNNILNLFLIFSLLLISGKLLLEIKFVVYAKWEQPFLVKCFNYLFIQTLKKPTHFFESELTGSLTSRIFKGLFGLKLVIFNSTFHILPLILEFCVIFSIFCIYFNLKMGLVLISSIIFYVILSVILNNYLLKYQSTIRDTTIDTEGSLTDLLSCWKDIKLNNGYQAVSDIFYKQINQMAIAYEIFYQKRSIYGALQACPLILIFIYANYLTLHDFAQRYSTMGDLLLINSYLWQLLKPLETFNLLFRDTLKGYNEFLYPIRLKILVSKSENYH